MSELRVYKDADADLAVVANKRVAIIGYGNQGHAHALNLRDAGVAEVAIGAREGSRNAAAARAAGFPVMSIAEAAAWADLVMLLTPDEVQADLYNQTLADALKPGATLAFAHGLNVQFGLIAPRADLDVILIAPKGPGHALRREYEAGRGLLCLVAVAQDASGHALDTALAYAAAIGGGRTGILQTTFKEECETDMFGEQAVLCGGLTNLVMAGFDTLVEAGYAPEMAYLECVHEVKLIADLMYERGIERMREAISNTAEFGDYRIGARVIGQATRAEMKRVLAEIQAGTFVDAFMADARAGQPRIRAEREAQRARPIEEVGARLRALMQNKG